MNLPVRSLSWGRKLYRRKVRVRQLIETATPTDIHLSIKYVRSPVLIFTDGIDHGLYNFTDALLHVEADVGKVRHVPLVDVGEVVRHQQLVQTVLVTRQLVHTRPGAKEGT